MEHIKGTDLAFLSLDGYSSKAKVVYVYDGDTVHLVYEAQDGTPKKVHARLAGIDTPEMNKTPNIAKIARNALITLATNVCVKKDDMRPSNEMKELFDQNTKILYAKFCGKEKYGRELVELYTSKDISDDFSKSVNQELVNQRHARLYSGGAKASW